MRGTKFCLFFCLFSLIWVGKAHFQASQETPRKSVRFSLSHSQTSQSFNAGCVLSVDQAATLSQSSQSFLLFPLLSLNSQTAGWRRPGRAHPTPVPSPPQPRRGAGPSRPPGNAQESVSPAPDDLLIPRSAAVLVLGPQRAEDDLAYLFPRRCQVGSS